LRSPRRRRDDGDPTVDDEDADGTGSGRGRFRGRTKQTIIDEYDEAHK
jgi:hypothetical protein